MADGTLIQWTHAPGFAGETWNPVIAVHKETGKRGWHCEHASRGCDHCYAEAQNRQGIRMGTKESFTRAARDRVDIQLLESMLLKPLSWRSPRCVFVCSMTDLFGEWVPFEWIDRIFAVMALCPQHRFLVLTKRAERMADYLTRQEMWGRVVNSYDEFYRSSTRLVRGRLLHHVNHDPFRIPNVWLGTTTENQATADERIPHLLRCPAAVRFLSCEPMIGPVDLTSLNEKYVDGVGGSSDCLRGIEQWEDRCDRGQSFSEETIEWIIVGGESGVGAREFDINWARKIVRDCKAAGVACFVKQLGKKPVDSMTGQRLESLGSHGAAFDSWPADLRVRQFPEVANA